MKLSTVVLISTGVVIGTASAYGLISRRSFGGHAVAGIGNSLMWTTPAALAADDFITLENGIQYKVLKEGDGAIPQAGQSVKAHYTGWLDGFDSDKKFDSSRDRGRPFVFKVGAGQVIRGWDDQFSQMKVGERRQIVLPPRMAYGDRGGMYDV
jgi:FKBP-type peptidyl-prolyl cis-trans isomerase